MSALDGVRPEPIAHDRFVGDHKVFCPCAIGNGTIKLASHNGRRAAARPFITGLTDTKNGDEPRPPGCRHFAFHLGIELMMMGSPLRMADDHGARSEICQHFSRNIAGEGAERLRVTILSSQRNRSRGDLCKTPNQCRRRQHHQIHMLTKRGGSSDDLLEFRSRGAHAVHFPIAGNEFAAWRLIQQFLPNVWASANAVGVGKSRRRAFHCPRETNEQFERSARRIREAMAAFYYRKRSRGVPTRDTPELPRSATD